MSFDNLWEFRILNKPALTRELQDPMIPAENVFKPGQATGQS